MWTGRETTDADLVAQSLAGQRDAFGGIVTRYQSLVCSLAYSATGSLGQSEDLAQETFITAWKHLRMLREPAKLRAWLCGIARNRINNALRREGREPLRTAEALDAAHETPAHEPLPSENVISDEEQALLWRSLEHIPQSYREALILFYREGQSVEQTAALLDLSEDAVKQRLSRGRKLLAEQVTAFVEGALKQSAPGRAFTLGVLAALPMFATSASAATLGTVAAKGSAAAKGAASFGLVGAILGPIVGILGGVLGTKVSIENAESPRERQFMIKVARFTWIFAGLFCLMIFAFVYLSVRSHALWKNHPVAVTVAFISLGVAQAIGLMISIFWTSRIQRRIRSEEAAKLPPGASARVHKWKSQPREYRSRWTFLGLPLIHIRMECVHEGKTLPAKGWIAIGNIAYGVLFAFGGLAVGTVSVGGFALGLLAIGGFGLGLLSVAGFALGLWAVGGAAVGYLASGGFALGWLAANGGAAVAHDFAVGGTTFARHANDEVARAFLKNNAFFIYGAMLMQRATLLIWLPVVLVIWQMLLLRRQSDAAHSKQRSA
jgi:RNA polymerase sigma factor (sigma-70 family)